MVLIPVAGSLGPRGLYHGTARAPRSSMKTLASFLPETVRHRIYNDVSVRRAAEDGLVRRLRRAAWTTGVTWVATSLLATTATAQEAGVDRLTPLPNHGAVPAIVDLRGGPSEEELAYRARARRYTQQIRAIRHKHFRSIKVPEIRAAGIEQLAEFVDPAAFRPMLEELAREQDDVRFAVLDHFADQGDAGQGALAWVAIHDEGETLRNEAIRRMVSPPSEPVLRVLDQSLRSPTHGVANHAGALAGALGAVEAIPLLIFAQATRDPYPSDEGDLAWIAIQTQTGVRAGSPFRSSAIQLRRVPAGHRHRERRRSVLRVTDADRHRLPYGRSTASSCR